LEGYINVHRSLWDHIPSGAHIRYIKKGDEDRSKRFKPGGFVKNHFMSNDGVKFMMIETKPNGKPGERGYISFPISYDNIAELWKKYDRNVFIEMHLTSTSLTQKKRQIDELSLRIKKIETALNMLIEELKRSKSI
jgi:hypothetical protein